MKWVGLTGNIATGKSTVSNLLKSKGFQVIDADEESRFVTARGQLGLDKIKLHFGPGFIDSNEELDRKKLAALVFSDSKAREELENIIHPLVKARVQDLKQKAQASGIKICFYDVPLLFEKNMQSQFDYCVVVVCDPNIQFQRLKLRSMNQNVSDDELSNRIKAQMPMEQKKNLADFVIENNGSIGELEKAVIHFLKSIGA